MSLLTKYIVRYSGNVNELPVSLSQCHYDDLRSIIDLKKCFDSVKIAKNFRTLTNMKSYVAGIDWLRYKCQPQGCAEGNRIISHCNFLIIDSLNRIPVHLPFKRFVEERDRLNRGEEIEAKPANLLSHGFGSYVDDVAINSPKSAKQVRMLGVKDDALFRQPKTDKDVAVYFHLQQLKKLFSQLEANNLLAAPSKVKILIQDQNVKYLGIALKEGTASIPQQSVDLIKSLPAPRTIKETQRILGLIQFFSSLVPHIRVHSFFLSRKLRKTEKFTWTSQDDEDFRLLKIAIGEAMMPGFLRLTTPCLLESADLLLLTDWAQSINVSSGVALLRYVENGQRHVVPAICCSHILPATFANHGSVIGELASLSACFLKLDRYLSPYPVIVYTDSISLVFLVQRRFQSATAMNNKLVQRLILALVPYHFICRWLPGRLIDACSDIFSRIRQERGMPVDELLEKPSRRRSG